MERRSVVREVRTEYGNGRVCALNAGGVFLGTRSAGVQRWTHNTVHEAETAEARVIIPHDPCGRHFFWLPTVSPDGEHIMFIHDHVNGAEGYQDLWVSDENGANAQRVPNTDDSCWFDRTH
jgi:hypothetical protein